ncbi:cation:proton antiporter [Ornithinimicrobium cryptoxanthini]|uniref:cation:proton antiporter n=1 Tax=Ornithinimicrobium cryptoxanthini TaxID=2934161 RepID=UPI00211887E4|nr:cation:proton antiporter [Ornithinimicrobium cryptoxanthini]
MTGLIGTVEMTLLVLLVAILAGPIIGAKFRVPGLLALIFLGMLFGPFALGWMGRTGLVFDLGSIGILYLMFLAGLGFNLNAFNDNRTSALGFGLLSFIVPFGLSLLAGLAYFEAGILAAALLGSMWASNTLVAYPDVRAAGLEQTRAVRDAMSGGVVADVLALLVLAVATTYAVVETVDPDGATIGAAPSLPLWVSIPLLVLFALWVLPRIGEWFFVRVGFSRMQRLLFALAAMAATATLAEVGGIAGIIGAFLAGIGLNRLVPKNSELMDRIDFVGSSIFIPAFLVSIGLRIDPAAMIDPRTLLMALVFIGLVVVGKGVAVLVAAVFFGYSTVERGLIGSLSIGQAASTLAVGQIGLELGLFEQRVVNASIVTIVVAALLTSFGTQFFIRKMPVALPTAEAIGERVLVDVRSASSDARAFVDFAGRIARGDDGVEIPFVVTRREDKAAARQCIAEAEEAATAAGYDCEGVLRLSQSFADGTLELADETDATMVIVDWDGPRPGATYFFGTELDHVGAGAQVPVIALQLTSSWKRVVVVPGTGGIAWHAEDARLTLEVARRLAARGDTQLLVVANDEAKVREHLDKTDYEFRAASRAGDVLLTEIGPTDLVVAPAYLLPEMPLHRRLQLSSRMADQNLALVAGAGRLTLAPQGLPNAMDRMLGQHH